jgi:hypothetical protein
VGFFSDQLKTRLFALVLVLGRQANGEPCYAYLSVRMDELKRFSEAQSQGGVLKLGEYGRILASGIGVPPEGIQQHLEETYGFSHTEFINITQPMGMGDAL